MERIAIDPALERKLLDTFPNMSKLPNAYSHPDVLSSCLFSQTTRSFRKLKEQGCGKSTFWSRPGAEIFVVIVIVDVAHAAAARDPILSTQRIRKVKISMVGIDKVKVRLHHLALAHVSHFFSRTRAVGAQAINAFFNFRTF